jgi:hypothetical protein
MNNQQFDPNKITIADIFRAKEERRRRLAKLPFEEKIEILKRLKTVPALINKNEKLVFDSFLRLCPDFAGEPIKEWDVVEEWYAKRSLQPPAKPFDERPDIVAATTSGKKIGIELKSWVNREQIAEARKEERNREIILNVIGEQGLNNTRHIGHVWLSAKQVNFAQSEASEFRRQLFSLIEQVDREWPQKPDWDRESDFRNDRRGDLTNFPVLAKYLDQVAFYAHPKFDSHWIHFPNRGGAYSPNDMLGTLSHALAAHKNDERYKDLKQRVGLDEVYLLVHYDFKAFAYDPPFAAPDFGFKEAAELAKESLNGNGGYFDKIFLFHFLWGEEQAYRIF